MNINNMSSIEIKPILADGLIMKDCHLTEALQMILSSGYLCIGYENHTDLNETLRHYL